MRDIKLRAVAFEETDSGAFVVRVAGIIGDFDKPAEFDMTFALTEDERYVVNNVMPDVESLVAVRLDNDEFTPSVPDMTRDDAER